MDNPVQKFFSQTNRRPMYLYIKKMRKGEVRKSYKNRPAHTKKNTIMDSRINKTLCKSRLLHRGQGQVYMRYSYEVVELCIWCLFSYCVQGWVCSMNWQSCCSFKEEKIIPHENKRATVIP